MENDNPVIYGLEFQTRALSAQTAETDVVRFLIGTQSLNFSNNQIHLVELNEETGNLKTQVFQHPLGEIWSLQASPTEPDVFITCYNHLSEEGTCQMKGAIWKFPEIKEYTNDILQLDKLADIDTTPYGTDLKTIAYHPMDCKKIVSVVDNNFVLWDLANGPQVAASGILAGKGQPRFTNGKWNPHNGANQFVTLNENNVRGWDFRSPANAAWSILSAHSQIIRDLDFNANRQYFLSTCGDDGYMKFWDIRLPTEPVLSRMEHSHWVWNIRINRFHDQLVLTSSSDSRVILYSIASISSEPFGHMVSTEDEFASQNDESCAKKKLEDGLVGRYEEHEDSVYAVEWSSADPWTFASLSYDGRLVLNKVPRKYKYQILL